MSLTTEHLLSLENMDFDKQVMGIHPDMCNPTNEKMNLLSKHYDLAEKYIRLWRTLPRDYEKHDYFMVYKHILMKVPIDLLEDLIAVHEGLTNTPPDDRANGDYKCVDDDVPF